MDALQGVIPVICSCWITAEANDARNRGIGRALPHDPDALEGGLEALERVSLCAQGFLESVPEFYLTLKAEHILRPGHVRIAVLDVAFPGLQMSRGGSFPV